VTAVNDAPIVGDDEYAIGEDEVLTIDAGSGVLGNDSDPDGDSLTASLVTGPEHGSLMLNEDGSFTYTPDADFHGTDSFTYVASDGTESSSEATVTITVAPANDAPVANNDEYDLEEDSSLTIEADGVLA